MNYHHNFKKQTGAALLLALLVVVMVVSFCTFVYWQQWKNIQVENSERQSQQANWLLTGGVDWSRLILRQDKQSSANDHLNEIWNTPLEEARLSSFINQEDDSKDINDDMANKAFISGGITDYNSRLNILNLIKAGKKNDVYYEFFSTLFQLLELPKNELDGLTNNLKIAFSPLLSNKTDDSKNNEDPLILPMRNMDLLQYGLSEKSINKLKKYIYFYQEEAQTYNGKDTKLVKQKININTASSTILQACFSGVDLGTIREITDLREREPFKNINNLTNLLINYEKVFNESKPYIDVVSDLFEINGQLRIDDLLIRAISKVERKDRFNVFLLDREYLAVERPKKENIK